MAALRYSPTLLLFKKCYSEHRSFAQSKSSVIFALLIELFGWQVLFPLLSTLLERHSLDAGVEETRFRASTLLSKVYLQHLHLLMDLTTFTALWLTILDFMDKYMHADNSDQLVSKTDLAVKCMWCSLSVVCFFIGGAHNREIE